MPSIYLQSLLYLSPIFYEFYIFNQTNYFVKIIYMRPSVISKRYQNQDTSKNILSYLLSVFFNYAILYSNFYSTES